MKLYKKLISATALTGMITSCAFAQNFTLYSNGNPVIDYNNINEGIISAVSERYGSVAIAKYKDGKLLSLDFASGEEGLTKFRANAVLNKDSYDSVRIFYFDKNMKPYVEDIKPSIADDDLKIYINENFNNGGRTVDCDGEYSVFSDGRAHVTYNGKSSGTRFGPFYIPYPEKNIIVEADYELGDESELSRITLMSIYNDGPKAVAFLHEEGLKPNAAGMNNPALVSREEINSGKFTVSLKLNLEELTYDLYYNRQKLNSTPYTLSKAIVSENRYDGFSMYVPVVANSGSVYVDNVKAYSGTEFVDIGDLRPNVHKMSVENSPTWESDIYERPDKNELAEKTLSTNHPRILINKDKIQQIKNAKNGRIADWRDIIVPKADAYLNTEPYEYKVTKTDSIENVRDAIDLFMHLGLAYQLTGDMKYPERAYKELEVIYNVAGGRLTAGGGKDYWNSYSYLCVAEMSFAVSIAYDWMYDAWTPAQRQAICDNITEKSLDRAYQAFYGELSPTISAGNAWWRMTNNWNGVCNGTMLITSVAFMETDPHKCANIAEACLRGFEYMLPGYAPMGAWTEGTGYWAYALKYLSASCKVLDDVCGTDYGIHKTPGLENSMFFPISFEGYTGSLSFGDAGGDHVHAPFLFYWAKKFNNPQIGGVAVYAMNEFDFVPDIFDLIYYDENYVTQDYQPPECSYFKGTETVNLASEYPGSHSRIVMSGGLGDATSHDHIDSGGIIVEKNGTMVFRDPGNEHYGAPGYFSKTRYWYYKARPEGHNVFVINPQNLYDENGEYYMGQSETAVSEITSYSAEGKSAVMDLTEAYSRDAKKAQRKIYIEEDRIVVEDEITLTGDDNVIEWYYHFLDTAVGQINGVNKYLEGYGTVEIPENEKLVYLTFKDFVAGEKSLVFTGEKNEYILHFVTDEDIEIEVRDAVRNPYDAEIISKMKSAGTFGYDYYNSKNTLSKIVVKMKNASGTVKLKTILE